MKPEKKGSKPGVRLRVVLGPDVALGPGKVAMLEEIDATGSIAAAGRNMGMSYKRAWYLVETMNRCFKRPVVAAAKGGRAGGGAVLTPLGAEVLARYRRMEKLATKAVQAEMNKLRKALIRLI